MQFGPGFTATFLYYFSGTAIIVSLIASQGLGISVQTGLPQQVGLVGGLVVGLIGAYFNRTSVLALPKQKKTVRDLDALLTGAGYEAVAEADGVTQYERSGLSKWVSGRVFLQEEKDTVTIASRASLMRRLQKALESPPEAKS